MHVCVCVFTEKKAKGKETQNHTLRQSSQLANPPAKHKQLHSVQENM